MPMIHEKPPIEKKNSFRSQPQLIAYRGACGKAPDVLHTP
jgi:hypothetical protein